MNQQTVEDKPESQTQSAQEGSDERNDLDEYLREFDEAQSGNQQSQQQETSEVSDLKKQLEEVTGYIKSQKERDEQQRLNAALDETYKAVKGDLDVDEEIVAMWVNRQADKDRRLLDAFNKREQNPQQWGKVLKSLHSNFSEFSERFRNPDKEAITSAVKAAGQGGNVPTDESVEWGRLNDAEFEARKMQLIRGR